VTPRRITVETRNLFVGFDVGALLSGAITTAEAFDTFLASNPAARAEAWADEIAATGADVVGLQEALLMRTGPFPDPAPADTVTVDFVALLLDALAARGLTYAPVATASNFAPEGAVGPPFSIDVRAIDRDVTLVRVHPRLQVVRASSGNYATTLATRFGPVQRGWTAVDVRLDGRTVRVVNTHLEAADERVRLAQAVELVQRQAGNRVPTILVGDFNSGPPAPTPTYELLARAFTDVWPQVGSGPGLTCCHDDATPAIPFDQRIDLILAGRGVRPVAATLVGAVPGSAFPFFPSDHAGVVATLEVS
jgi:endonuclease/exonuclease/phosphatase family metal-dependent hydrolase